MIMKKILNWFRESNRYRHAYAGLFIYAFMISIGWAMSVPLAESAAVATASTLIAMVSVEYKDKQHGGRFDWPDVLAGMALPALLDAAVSVSYLF